MDKTLIRFDRLFDETTSLLDELKRYVESKKAYDNGFNSPGVCFVTIRETRRVVCRLATVMAWLLAERAHYNGEITKSEFTSEKYSLSSSSVCANLSHEDNAVLPETLRGLQHKSYALYIRTSRIEAMVRASGVNDGIKNTHDEALG